MLTFSFQVTKQYQNVAAERLKKRSVRQTATAATTMAAPPPHHASTAASAWCTHPANGAGRCTPVAFCIYTHQNMVFRYSIKKNCAFGTPAHPTHFKLG
jgi:hypothetical protein